MQVSTFGKTDVGKVREHNEDNILVAQRDRLFAVCDGMGGHASGEVASLYAIELIKDFFIQKNFNVENEIFSELSNLPADTQRLITAIRLANQRIYLESAGNAERRGMGTTIAVVYFNENDFASLVNVGDSRIYRLRGDSFEQLTKDHTWLNELIEDKEIKEEEISQFRQKNVLTRALGVGPTVKIDIRIEPVKNNDIFLICSDGLSGLLSNEEIKSIIENNRENLNMAVDYLIALANAKGGTDNISVVLLKTDGVLSEMDTESKFYTIEENEASVQILQKQVRKHYKIATGKKPLYTPILIILGIVLMLAGIFIFKLKKPSALKPSVAKLAIKTEPSGALLKLNGNDIGKTPCQIDSLQVGKSYYISLLKTGYFPKSESIVINDTTEIRNIILRPEAVVKVSYWEAKTGDAELFIDGNSIGILRELEEKEIPISEGIHQVCVKLFAKEIFSEKLEIKKGDTVRIEPDASEKNRVKIIGGGG